MLGRSSRIMLKPYLSLFFLGLIVVVSIGLMNLVTAAVLELLWQHPDAMLTNSRCCMSLPPPPSSGNPKSRVGIHVKHEGPSDAKKFSRNAMQAAVQDAEAEKNEMMNTVKDRSAARS